VSDVSSEDPMNRTQGMTLDLIENDEAEGWSSKKFCSYP